jgi:hypothetical protein
MTLAEMKCMRGTTKYTWQVYRTNDDILIEPKINPIFNKFQNYRNKWIQRVQ